MFIPIALSYDDYFLGWHRYCCMYSGLVSHLTWLANGGYATGIQIN